MTLTEDQLQRYHRNIVLKDVGLEGQKVLRQKSVLVAGAGGLGSPVITYLAAAGVGKLGIIDCDKVHLSNLNRQFLHHSENMGTHKVHSARGFVNKLNPDVKVDIFQERITVDNVLGLLSPYDCVVDCLDTLPLKFLLNDACVQLKKPLVHAGVVAFHGQITTIIPQKTACLRCLFKEFPGCNVTPTSLEVGILGACAGVLGALQAVEVIKYFTNNPGLTNKLLIYDGLHTSFKTMKLARNKNCPICSTGKMADKEEYATTRNCTD